MKFFSRFVDSNDRELRRLQPIVDEANELEEEIAALSDDEIRERFNEIREEIREIAEPDEPSDDERHHPDLERRRELTKARRKKENDRIQSALDQVAAEVFAMGREAMKRTLGMRQYDVQIMGGVVLHQGKIAEMKTGEGKTFIPTFAAVLNSLTGRGVHIVTVNDYLARRDPQWMGPVYHFLGVSVGMITHDESFVFEPGYPTTDERLINLRPVSRREAYAADITYGTNNEFGFDYLRDNMVTELDQRVQRERSFAIVDEVDNILIDEARTPLIISGQAEESADLYYTFARLVPAAQGPARGRGGGRRLLRRPQGQGRLADRGRHREDGGLPRHREPLRLRPAPRPPLRAGAPGPRALQARPRLHRQGRRDRHRRRVHRPPDARPALVARASTRRSRRRRASRSSASR